ncbi:hypothetical protein ABZP36_028106 [Zizania latifolia]
MDEAHLCKSGGEDDEDFQITEYQAQRGNTIAMHKLELLYYYGLRGVSRDYGMAYHWFLKAVEKGDTRAMELLGEICVKGAGVERNYTESYKWLTLAAKQQQYSAYNGLGYGEGSNCIGETSFCTDMERHLRAHALWWQEYEQGNEHAALLIGDAYYYVQGVGRNYERSAEAYMPLFFIRDGMKFPDMVQAFKPSPKTLKERIWMRCKKNSLILWLGDKPKFKEGRMSRT